MKSGLISTSLTLLLLLTTAARAGAPPPDAAHATFVVHCYDVGVDALAGRTGVIRVERGWSGGREVDRVVYDPQRVSAAQLERWLKDAGTYVETLNEEKSP